MEHKIRRMTLLNIHYGPEQKKEHRKKKPSNHSVSQELRSEWVSEQTSEQSEQYKASKQVSDPSERANRRVSGPVPTFYILGCSGP